MEIHQKKLKGEDPSQIETKFLKLACPLDSYGIDPHPVKVNFSFLSLKQMFSCYIE